jgi:hypothetical protein
MKDQHQVLTKTKSTSSVSPTSNSIESGKRGSLTRQGWRSRSLMLWQWFQSEVNKFDLDKTSFSQTDRDSLLSEKLEMYSTQKAEMDT